VHGALAQHQKAKDKPWGLSSPMLQRKQVLDLTDVACPGAEGLHCRASSACPLRPATAPHRVHCALPRASQRTRSRKQTAISAPQWRQAGESTSSGLLQQGHPPQAAATPAPSRDEYAPPATLPCAVACLTYSTCTSSSAESMPLHLSSSIEATWRAAVQPPICRAQEKKLAIACTAYCTVWRGALATLSTHAQRRQSFCSRAGVTRPPDEATFRSSAQS